MTHRAEVFARFATSLTVLATLGCTISHSKQALYNGMAAPPSEDAFFITEEDSGLALAGLVHVSEPDHYAVLLERARRRHRCRRVTHAQLDYYTDFWLVVSFPISRVTLLCERDAPETESASPERSLE
jgi:hypothetical protein